MKRVLFDQNVPAPLRRSFQTCDITLASEMGWSRTKNGLLLSAAEHAGFDVFLSSDRSMQYEQNMDGRKIAVVGMSDNHWTIVRPYASAIVQAVELVHPGEFIQVFCGKFMKFSNRAPTF